MLFLKLKNGVAKEYSVFGWNALFDLIVSSESVILTSIKCLAKRCVLKIFRREEVYIMKNNKLSLLMAALMCVSLLCMGNTFALAQDTAKGQVEPVKKVPANPQYDPETDTTDWDYVTFGSYPQTEVCGEQLTTEIINAEYNNNETVIDGQKYRRIRESQSNYSSVNYAEGFYNWKKTFAYFKYEPIKWRVLENDGETLLLMADSVIDCRQYAENDNSVTWETSYIRKWLNGYGFFGEQNQSFLDYAFTEKERAAITRTTVTDSDNPFHKTKGGNDTQDQVFLLSIREMLNESYGFPADYMMYSKTRRLSPTDYAHAMGVWMSSAHEEYGDYCWWLLRSPGSHTKAVSLVYRFGHVYQDGYYADTKYYGVCPAVRIDVDSDAWTLVEKESADVKDSPVQKQDRNSIAQKAVQVQNMAALTGEAAIYGDADGNRIVELKDAQIALKCALNLIDVTDYVDVCDVDADKEVTLLDARLILKYALNLIDKFPVEEKELQTSDKPAVETSARPQVSEKPVTGASAQPSASGAPSKEPQTSERPSPPVPPSSVPITPAPDMSGAPLEQQQHDASGRMWIAADSIAVSYHSNDAQGLCGWGEVIGSYFDQNVDVQNMAIGGRSSKSFTTEKKYETIMNEMSEGDYLFISFGHNDERAALELYTDPFGSSSTSHSYKWYLKEYYIDPAIRAGVQPVLVSPVARRYFLDGALINPQLHTPYAEAMEELVEEYAKQGITVYYIDLHHKMLDLYEELGESGTGRLHAKNDTTHLCRAGIDIVCDYMVEEMKKQNMNLCVFLTK